MWLWWWPPRWLMCSGQLETFAIVVIGMAAQCSTTMNGGTHPLSMHIYISYGVYSIHHTFSVFCTTCLYACVYCWCMYSGHIHRLCNCNIYVYPWINRSVNQSTNQPINQSVYLFTYLSMHVHITRARIFVHSCINLCVQHTLQSNLLSEICSYCGGTWGFRN